MKQLIIATVGPTSLKPDILSAFKARGVSFIRLNLSHTPIDQIESQLLKMKSGDIPIIIDTEGSQIRTGYLGKDIIVFSEGDTVRIYNHEVPCNEHTVYLRPKEAFSYLEPGSLISIDFQSVLLKVTDISKLASKNYVDAQVLIGGVFGNNKAVTFDMPVKLPAFSEKDFAAVKIAKKLKIKHFTLSFMDAAEEVLTFKELYPSAFLFSKIETKGGVLNFEKILQVSDGILIDRGDLSRDIAQEMVPLAQKMIIKRCNEVNKPVVVATNILESMTDNFKPMKSELNDIVNTIIDGTNGFVLTKESAVGKHPVETVNMLHTLFKNTKDRLDAILESKGDEKNLLQFLEYHVPGLLVEPHGGELVNRIKIQQFSPEQLADFPKVELDEELLMDLELIATGVYSPLKGFMNKETLDSVLVNMRLKNGLPWTMPILLTTDQKAAFDEGTIISLVRKKDGKIYGTMTVDSIFKLDKTEVCKKWFGTNDPAHPGVARIMEGGSYCVGGPINLLKRRTSEYKEYELTPLQTRKIFQEKGWSIVVGFHTRNVIHRSHEFIQLAAMEQVKADGLFVHPVVGKKKSGDFLAEMIIKAYELMMRKFYPKGKVIMGVYPTYSRYAGPREAIFTAICRKNYGCSHFIVGRDHTGVGDFYQPWASHEIFAKFPDLGINPVFFKKVAYEPSIKKHIIVDESEEKHTELKHISGTEARKLFLEKKAPPDWFMRSEISKLIIEEYTKGKPVFVK